MSENIKSSLLCDIFNFIARRYPVPQAIQLIAFQYIARFGFIDPVQSRFRATVIGLFHL
jgi:hypothetical protein